MEKSPHEMKEVFIFLTDVSEQHTEDIETIIKRNKIKAIMCANGLAVFSTIFMIGCKSL